MGSNCKLASLMTGVCALVVAVASAQPPPLPASPRDTVFFAPSVAPLPVFGGQIDILGPGGSVAGPVVEGKPYSARSITESTQLLADGNRIVQRNEATIHRDGAGRTRREQTLAGVGFWQAGQPLTMINIHDPVADKTFMLDPAARTAREIRPFRMAIAEAREVSRGQAQLDVAKAGAVWTAAVPAPPPGTPPAERGLTVVRRIEGNGDNVQVFTDAGPGVGPAAVHLDINAAMGAFDSGEDLGEQVLEGLLVRGRRLTDTIPAGAMGNERPIEVVTERWYSEEIDALVLQRFADPRFGETIYRLVNVVRGEPSPDLFEVPQGYERKSDDGPQAGVRVMPGPAGQRIEFQLQRAPGDAPGPH